MPSPRVRASLEDVAAEAEVPIVPWEEVAPEFIDNWEQGQHLVTLGKTGRGKSTFVIEATTLRWKWRQASVCVFITKQTDETWSKTGWGRIADWPPTYKQRQARRVLFWPPYTKASTYAQDRRQVFLEAFDEILAEGKWTLVLDEASYLVQSMHLRTSIDELFTQSRSAKITLVAGSQRPVWVSRGEVSQHSWLAAFKVGDMDDARRAGEVIGDRDRYTAILHALGDHDFVLVNTVTGQGVITRIDKPQT
jgi:hypothetical protein